MVDPHLWQWPHLKTKSVRLNLSSPNKENEEVVLSLLCFSCAIASLRAMRLSPSRLAYLSNLCEEFLKNQPQSKRTVISCKVSIVSPGSQFLSRDFPEYLRQAQAHGERGLPCPFNESNIFQHCCHDMS